MITDLADATDNFLSNWANGITSELQRARAEIDAAGGVSTFRGLYQENRRVKAKRIQTKFGHAWLLHDDEVDLIAARGKKFLPYGTKSRIHAQLGLREASETAPAFAFTKGEQITQVRVQIARSGDKWGQDATEGETK